MCLMTQLSASRLLSRPMSLETLSLYVPVSFNWIQSKDEEADPEMADRIRAKFAKRRKIVKFDEV